MGRPVVPLSREKNISLSRCPFVPGQNHNLIGKKLSKKGQNIFNIFFFHKWQVFMVNIKINNMKKHFKHIQLRHPHEKSDFSSENSNNVLNRKL